MSAVQQSSSQHVPSEIAIDLPKETEVTVAKRIHNLNAEQIESIAEDIVEEMIKSLRIDPPEEIVVGDVKTDDPSHIAYMTKSIEPASTENRAHFRKYMLSLVKDKIAKGFSIPASFMREGVAFNLAGKGSLIERTLWDPSLNEALWRGVVLLKGDELLMHQYEIYHPRPQVCWDVMEGSLLRWKEAALRGKYTMTFKVNLNHTNQDRLYFDLRTPDSHTFITLPKVG